MIRLEFKGEPYRIERPVITVDATLAACEIARRMCGGYRVSLTDC